MISLTKRKEPAAPAVDDAATVQAARTRARRRLIGAAVLVGIGIVGFPLLFETQPRPIAVDIPIEIPSKDGAPPLSLPASRPAAVAERSVAEPAQAPASTVAAASPAAPPPQAPSGPVAAAPATPPATVLPPVVPAPPARADGPSPAAPADPAATDRARDAQRAQALLEGRVDSAAPPASAADAKAPRFVVQAGAYTDPAALREARQKVERLGLKTYTQVIEVDGSSRTRVRVGPFATRDEAEKAAARIKTTGLAANILVL